MFSLIAPRQRLGKHKTPKRRASRGPLRQHTRLRIEHLEPRVLLSACGSVRGTVFDDLDGDGVFDSGEPGLPGVEVELQRVGNVARTFESSAMKGNSVAIRGDRYLIGVPGSGGPGGQVVHLFDLVYTFKAVHPDNYVVSAVVPEGYTQSLPNGDGTHLTIRIFKPFVAEDDTQTLANDDGTYAISVQGDDILFGLDFGAVNDVQLPVSDPVPPPEDGTASGTVFDDLDGDGVFDPGEPGLPGLEVRLERLAGHLRTFESRGGDGNSVAIRGNRYLIGAPGNGGPGAQVVYLFDLATGDVLHTFSNPNPEVRGDFGQAVAFVGNDVLVAAPYFPWLDGGHTQILEDQPFAYLFDGATGRLLQSFRDPFAGDNGHRMSLISDNSRVLIGDSRDGAAFSTDDLSPEPVSRRSLRFDAALDDWEREIAFPLEVDLDLALSDLLFEAEPTEIL